MTDAPGTERFEITTRPYNSGVQFDELEQTLAARGRDIGRMRVAAARSGIVVGFPTDPLLHVSWWAFAGAGVLAVVLRRRS
jgi:hypothetical protein